MELLLNLNYMVRKISTPETQCVQRTRLYSIIFQENVLDIQKDESVFYTDHNMIDKPELFHYEIP